MAGIRPAALHNSCKLAAHRSKAIGFLRDRSARLAGRGRVLSPLQGIRSRDGRRIMTTVASSTTPLKTGRGALRGSKGGSGARGDAWADTRSSCWPGAARSRRMITTSASGTSWGRKGRPCASSSARASGGSSPAPTGISGVGALVSSRCCSSSAAWSSAVRRSSRRDGGSGLAFLRRLRTRLTLHLLAALGASGNRLEPSAGPACRRRAAALDPVSIPTQARCEKHGPLHVPRLGCGAGSFGPVENFSRKR
jgi:hypothetical protein